MLGKTWIAGSWRNRAKQSTRQLPSFGDFKPKSLSVCYLARRVFRRNRKSTRRATCLKRHEGKETWTMKSLKYRNPRKKSDDVESRSAWSEAHIT
jgi:hypothetical protein